MPKKMADQVATLMEENDIMPWTWRDLFTFGMHAELSAAEVKYERQREALVLLLESAEQLANQVQATLHCLGHAKLAAQETLKRIHKTVRVLQPENLVGFDSNEVHLWKRQCSDVDSAQSFLAEAASSGIAATAGGATVALSAWVLVGSFGSASTGTAIVSLSGAAATNATLAWFGGGSLASGAGGMAAGGVVLGGLFLVPAIAVAAGLAHLSTKQRLADLEMRMTELKETRVQVKAAMGALVDTRASADERRRQILELSAELKSAIEHSSVIVTVNGLFFSLIEWFYRQLGKCYLSEAESKELKDILTKAAKLSRLIEKPLVEPFTP